jgi:hypothetical protein
MSLILRQVIGEQRGKRIASLASADPQLKKDLDQAQQDLNSILNKWKFNNRHPSTSHEFLNQFAPWIEEQIESKKDLKLFLAQKGVNNLQEAKTKLINKDLEETSELDQFLSDNQANNLNDISHQLISYETKIQELKDQIAQLKEENSDPLGLNNLALEQAKKELAQAQQTFANTEQDYLKRIEELTEQIKAKETFTYEEDTEDESPFPSRQKLQHDLTQAQEEIRKLKETSESSEELAELETERDQLARDKLTLEQEVLATNNRLNLKQQEVTKKEQEIARIKKEKSDQSTALNKTIKNWKDQHEELQKKYSRRTKLLDEEQCENNKLTEKIEQLEAQIATLTS